MSFLVLICPYRSQPVLNTPTSTDHHQDCEADEIPDEGQLNSTLNDSTEVNSEIPDEGQLNSTLNDSTEMNSEILDEGQLNSTLNDSTEVNSEIPDEGQLNSTLNDSTEVNSEIPDEGQLNSTLNDSTEVNSEISEEGQLNSTLNNSSDVDSETVDESSEMDESSESRTDIHLNSTSSSSSEADTDIEENSIDLYSEEEDEMKLDDELLGPVYDGSKVTVLGAYCAIMEFKRACRLPFTAIAMLLQLLQLLCPSVNKLPRSVYVFPSKQPEKTLEDLDKLLTG